MYFFISCKQSQYTCLPHPISVEIFRIKYYCRIIQAHLYLTLFPLCLFNKLFKLKSYTGLTILRERDQIKFLAIFNQNVSNFSQPQCRRHDQMLPLKLSRIKFEFIYAFSKWLIDLRKYIHAYIIYKSYTSVYRKIINEKN